MAGVDRGVVCKGPFCTERCMSDMLILTVKKYKGKGGKELFAC